MPGSPSAGTFWLIAQAPVLAIWGIVLMGRCPDRFVRGVIIGVTILLLFWFLAVLIKYPAHHDGLTRLLWYCYYIPMLFLPWLCFLAAVEVTFPLPSPARTATMWTTGMCTAALCALVLSNSSHMLAFSFSLADPHWNGEYAYGPVYYLVAIWSGMLYLAFFGLLFALSRQHRNLVFIPLLALTLGGAIYGALYAMRIGGIFSTNFSLVYATVFMAAFELCFDSGLLPGFRRYRDTFRLLPVDLKIVDACGRLTLLSDGSGPLQPDERAALLGVADGGDRPVRFNVASQPGNAYWAWKVPGGQALLTEDISRLLRRQQEAFSLADQVRERNAVLQRSIAVDEKIFRQIQEASALERVEEGLAAAADSIRTLIADLDERASLQDRRDALCTVRLLAGYAKRKGALLVDESAKTPYDAATLQLVFAEMAADARSLGIAAAATVSTKRKLPVPSVSILFDCAYRLAMMAARHGGGALLIAIRDGDGNALKMSAVLQCETPPFDGAPEVEEFRQWMDRSEAAYSITPRHDTLKLEVLVRATAGCGTRKAADHG